MKPIDLGKNYGEIASPQVSEKGKHYPNLYINDVEGLDLEIGDISFTAKGKVVGVTERKDKNGKETYTCEIEIHSITPSQEIEIEDVFDKVAKKKASKMSEMEDEY
jgi:hypothetical protein